ncbi:MAG: hypothetical protein ACK4IK_08325 [Bacteroidia bacterium]
MENKKLFIRSLIFGAIITLFHAEYKYKIEEPFQLLNTIAFFSSISLLYFALMFLIKKKIKKINNHS